MKRFTFKFILFLTIPILLSFFIYWAYYIYTLPRASNAYYIWGDSQMRRGLDLDDLNINTQYRYFSSAKSGAGIYDFLVFAELVPKNSNVIIQISRPALIRPKKKDRNISAIKVYSLFNLKENNYSYQEILTIIKKNIKLQKIFFQRNQLLKTVDSLKINGAPTIEKFYSKKPTYLNDKKNLYIHGIEVLIDKKCKIIAIVFPCHPVWNEIESKSPYLKDLIKFDNEISKYFINSKTIELSSELNNFSDLTHLNKRGASNLTSELIKLDYLKNEFTLLINVKVKQE